MSDTKFSICSRASITVGAKPIESFGDGTTESLIALQVYDARVRELLGQHDWRFAQNLVELQHLAAAPEARWQHAWQLPPDYLKLLSIEAGGVLLREFQVNGDQIHCNVDEDTSMVLEYIRVVAEAWFPARFTIVLEERLAADFAGAIREDAALAGFHRGQAGTHLLTAKRMDRLSQPAKKFPVGRLRAARF